MTKEKSSKRAWMSAALSVLLCVAMLIGTTFAWFTSTASTAVNKIQAGNLKVDIVDQQNESLNGKTLSFKNKEGKTDILWEPGATFALDPFQIVNKGDLAFKYKVLVNGIKGNAKLLESLAFTVKIGDETRPLTDWEGILLPAGSARNTAEEAVGITEAITISATMRSDAGNEYQGLTLEGLGITVVATQYTYESDSYGNAYDEEAGKDTAFYSLAEFNALTAIPDGVKNVYVKLDGASLEGGITVGNANIADHYNYTRWDQNTAPAGYPYNTGRTDTQNDSVRYLYSTGKPAVNIILTGSVLGAKDTGGFNAGCILLQVPDASNVTFKNVAFGAGQMAMKTWQESFQSTTVRHQIAKVTFDNCVFNGNWIQNGDVGSADIVIKNSTFHIHENTGYKENSNPIWIQNLRQSNVLIEGCTFHAVRPIKLWEGEAEGTVTIRNNTFNMRNFADAAGEDVYRNVAIMFCGTTERVKLGNVEITGNTVNGNATAFIGFYNKDTQYPSLKDGASFKLSGNVLNNAKESVLWKTDTEWKPDYITR